MQEIWYSLIGDIDINSARQFITWTNDQAYRNPIKKLKVFLSSEGGDVESALVIYHYLKALPFETEMVAFNKIGSVANVIFLGSQKRIAVKGCTFVIHEGTNTINNPTATIHQHEDNVMWMKDRINRHIEVLSTETGQNREDIEKAMATTVFLTTIGAMTFGLVTEIVDTLPLEVQ